MRSLIPSFLLLTALLFAPLARAAEVHLGTITGAASTNNLTTAATFSLGSGQRILIQPDVAVYVLLGTSSSAAVTALTGIKVAADEKFEFVTGDSLVVLAILPVAGTASTKVYRVQ